jgi:hypothetical protein
MASGEPSWDLSDNDMSALKHALRYVPGSDFYKPPAAENQGGPDSASCNKPSAPLPDFTVVYDAVKEWYDSAPGFAMPTPADIAKFTYDFVAGNSARR